jgi:acetyl esterase/lipase
MRFVLAIKWLTCAILSSFSCLTCSSSFAYALVPDVNVSYGPDSSQQLDICRPVSRGPHPAVLLIHGGGWMASDKRGYAWMCRIAADHGIVGIAINFRPTDGSLGHRLVDQFQDVTAAADWVFSHSPDLEIDRHRVCTFGSSSGGHLAVLLALQKHDKSSRIACAVDEFGPVDLTTYRPPIVRLFGPVSVGDVTAMERIWSPLFQVTPEAPPMLMVHGIDDVRVPLAQPEALYLALHRAGTDARMLTFDGGHSFDGTTAAERIAIAEAELNFISSATLGQGPGVGATKTHITAAEKLP